MSNNVICAQNFYAYNNKKMMILILQNACKEIMKRLQPIIDSNPDDTWENWIKTAYSERISLSATGFYKTPDIGYSFETNTGKPFNYFTYGVACTEVEIDCLTGDHKVIYMFFYILHK